MDRVPQEPVTRYKNNLKCWYLVFKLYARKGDKGKRIDVFGTQVGGKDINDNKHWVSEAAAKRFIPAVWAAYRKGGDATVEEEFRKQQIPYQTLAALKKRPASSQDTTTLLTEERGTRSLDSNSTKANWRKLSSAEKKVQKRRGKEGIKITKQIYLAELWEDRLGFLKKITDLSLKKTREGRMHNRNKVRLKDSRVRPDHEVLSRKEEYWFKVRVQVLQARISLYAELYTRLKGSLMTDNAWRYIISRDSVTGIEEGEEVEEADDNISKTRESYSTTQMSRVIQQVSVSSEFYESFRKRDEEELQIVLSFDKDYKKLITVEDKLNLFRNIDTKVVVEHRSANSVPAIIMAIRDTYSSIAMELKLPNAAKTISGWINEFQRSGYRGFKEDLRGSFKRDSFLETHNLVMHLKSYMKNTQTLSVEACYKFLVKLINDKLNDKSIGGHDNILDVNKEISVSRATVQRWMVLYGARYDTVVKSYYTDNHNHPEIMKYRDTIYTPLRLKLMRRMPCWVEVRRDEADAHAVSFALAVRGLMASDTLPSYIKEGLECVRVHKDSLKEEEYIKYQLYSMEETGLPAMYLYHETTNGLPPDVECICRGICRGTCKCHLPVLHCGQDEAVYFVSLLGSKAWCVDGETQLRPKEGAAGVMMSFFNSEEIGFGDRSFDDAAYLKINAQRKIDFPQKKPFEAPYPGIDHLHYGKNKEGYWTSEEFMQQVKDYVYCVHVITDHKFQIVLEVDSSSGHLKKQEGGLGPRPLKWGGKSKFQMRTSTNLSEECICLTNEQYPATLSPGDDQVMTFVPGDRPPFKDPLARQADLKWSDMSAQEKEQHKDKHLAFEARKKKAKLKKKNKLRKNRHELVLVDDEDEQNEEEGDEGCDEYTVYGYIGKCKGTLQILYERGMYKDGMHGTYSAKDRRAKLAKGIRIDDSLDAGAVLLACQDFRDEVTVLQAELALSKYDSYITHIHINPLTYCT